jgi:hypothetical protein
MTDAIEPTNTRCAFRENSDVTSGHTLLLKARFERASQGRLRVHAQTHDGQTFKMVAVLSNDRWRALQHAEAVRLPARTVTDIEFFRSLGLLEEHSILLNAYGLELAALVPAFEPFSEHSRARHLREHVIGDIPQDMLDAFRGSKWDRWGVPLGAPPDTKPTPSWMRAQNHTFRWRTLAEMVDQGLLLFGLSRDKQDTVFVIQRTELGGLFIMDDGTAPVPTWRKQIEEQKERLHARKTKARKLKEPP